MRKRWMLILLLLACVGPWLCTAQCVMCRTQIESNIEEQRTKIQASGINQGILYLLLIPYLCAAGVVIAWYRHAKKQKKKNLLKCPHKLIRKDKLL